ncbi:MAG: dehydrogenase E1 component subunit alpha/beta [Microscillaceae bacterium]|nr:dehydrogenase E1 component subunit alpha/beta [Microscillaceae bacterium]
MQSSVQNSFLKFNRYHYNDEQLTLLYKALVRPRLIEEKMLIYLRQGKISKWFSGIGQEAVSVGAAMALESDEYIFPLHRNLGVFTTRDVPLKQLFAQFQGKKEGFTKGRDRSFHFGSKAHYIVGMISHLGPQLSLAGGVALADILENKHKVTLAFSGDGATSEGEFHEALNVAAVWQLPVIFIVENNGYGLSTPNYEQFRCKQIVDKGIGYGIEAIPIEGNNILEVYHTINMLADDLRYNPRPILVEALTFRMRGHEEASGVKYVPEHLFEAWATKDPVGNFEHFVLQEGIMSWQMIQEFKEDYKDQINQAFHEILDLPAPSPFTEEELEDVYAPAKNEAILPEHSDKSTRRFVDAISDGLRQSMELYPNLVLMGQDIAEYGGVFKVTEGFVQEFGRGRVRNTPLCESAIIGVGLGLSIRGFKSVIEMQFADFVSCGFNQIVNNLAKTHYRWGQHADVVVRMPTGAGVAAGPFHSQSNEAWFFHTPGLKIVYPSSPYDAKGLLNAAIEDPNPVLYFEHKFLYRSLQEEIPNGYYTIPIGEAKLVEEGDELSIISYGLGIVWAKEALQELNLEGKVDILDLRTLLPWDKAAVAKTTQKTGKVLILHEDTLQGGIGAEIAAWIGEHCFTCLDAPVIREASLDTPVPFAPNLEKNFLPKQRLLEKIEFLRGF